MELVKVWKVENGRVKVGLNVMVQFDPQEGVQDIVSVFYEKYLESGATIRTSLNVDLLEELGMLKSFWQTETWLEEYHAVVDEKDSLDRGIDDES